MQQHREYERLIERRLRMGRHCGRRKDTGFVLLKRLVRQHDPVPDFSYQLSRVVDKAAQVSILANKPYTGISQSTGVYRKSRGCIAEGFGANSTRLGAKRHHHNFGLATRKVWH